MIYIHIYYKNNSESKNEKDGNNEIDKDDTKSLNPMTENGNENENLPLSCPMIGIKNENNDKKIIRKVNYLDLSEYNFINFTIYILYAPLYIAGPIITFNDFILRYADLYTSSRMIFPPLYLKF
jgi:hypothetical protein